MSVELSMLACLAYNREDPGGQTCRTRTERDHRIRDHAQDEARAAVPGLRPARFLQSDEEQAHEKEHLVRDEAREALDTVADGSTGLQSAVCPIRDIVLVSVPRTSCLPGFKPGSIET